MGKWYGYMQLYFTNYHMNYGYLDTRLIELGYIWFLILGVNSFDSYLVLEEQKIMDYVYLQEGNSSQYFFIIATHVRVFYYNSDFR